MTDDAARRYLRQRGCATHVIDGGLEGLVVDWEREAQSIASGEPRCDEDCYVNDMDGRQILHDLFAALPDEPLDAWNERVRRADEQMRPHMIPTRECIWGPRNAIRHGYVREVHWWYFHRPKVDTDFFV